jgi:hypothetical protein
VCKSRLLARVLSGGLAACLTAWAVLLSGEVASADPAATNLGTLTIIPATGTDIIGASAHTSAACPTTANAANLLITGPIGVANPTFPPDNPYLLTTGSAAFSSVGPFDLPFRKILRDAATERMTTLQPGEYDLTAQCVDGLFQTVFGTFTGAMFFTSMSSQTSDPSKPNLTYTSTNLNGPSPSPSPSPLPGESPSPSPSPSPTNSSPSPSPSPSPVPPPDESPSPSPSPPGTGSTATELFAFPAKAHPDSFVLLIAKVAPANVAGTVQFNDGTATLGDPVPVFNGFALFFMAKLISGAHSLTAVFTPTDSTVSPSTSNTVSYGENVAHGVSATKTRLTLIPSGPFAQAVPRLLVANVTPTGAAGTVQFSDGSSALGAPVQVLKGVAFLSTSTLAPGTHSLTAAFTPTDPAAFGPSTSAVVSLTAGAGSQPPIPGLPANGSVFQPLQQLFQSLFSGLGL